MKYDVIIIGAGPAGYVSAIRAAQVGLKTALVEKKYIGGMCLNWGCIPTKSIIESAKLFDRIKDAEKFGIDGLDFNKIEFNWQKAVKRSKNIVTKLTGGIEYLLRKNEVDIIMGEAIITSPNTVTVANRNIEASNIIIATGSYPRKINKKLPESLVVDIENLYDVKELPENIVIIGHGPYSIELAQFFNLINKNVSLVSSSEGLIPKVDSFLRNFIIKKIKSDGIKLILDQEVTEFNMGFLKVGEESLKCDMILNCNHRDPVIPQSKIKIDLTDEGHIETNANFQTNQENIFAVGDNNGLSYLAHVASAQGIWVVNYLKGITNQFNLKNYPINIYTNPEMAQIGLTEQELLADKIDYKINEFPLTANGKALTEANYEGLIRLLSDKKYGQVLGVQIIASNATDMIAEASAFMQMEGTIYDVAQTIHAHPTVSEIFMEAGFDAIDKSIHK